MIPHHYPAARAITEAFSVTPHLRPLYSATGILALLASALYAHVSLTLRDVSFYATAELLITIMGLLSIAFFILYKHHDAARIVVTLSYSLLSLGSLIVYGIASPHVPITLLMTFIASSLLLDFRSTVILSLVTTAMALTIGALFNRQAFFLLGVDEILLYGESFIAATALILLYRRERPPCHTDTESDQALHRFALFGQLCAATAHDIANRLCLLEFTIDSLNLSGPHKNMPDAQKAKQHIHDITTLFKETRAFLLTPHTENPTFDPLVVITHVSREAEQLCQQKNIALSCVTTVNGEHPVPALQSPGHALAFQHILLVLIRNAIDACSASSNTRTSSAAAHILISSVIDGNFIVINIIDNGPGLPRRTKRALFTPHASSKTDGMGVGLYLAHELAKTHLHGSVIFSPRALGAHFSVRIPVLPFDAPVAASVQDVSLPQ